MAFNVDLNQVFLCVVLVPEVLFELANETLVAQIHTCHGKANVDSDANADADADAHAKYLDRSKCRFG